MNRMNTARRAQVIRCLIEGCSINSTVRMTGAAKHTVLKLLVDLGASCVDFLNETMVDLHCERIQVDEIWQFVGCKQKNVTAKKIERDGICGDVWTWTAIDADTKLIPCWMIGQRDAMSAHDFMVDLAGRLAGRVQLTSDGLRFYRQAVKAAFGQDIDYAMLVKIYGASNDSPESRYSPATCIGCRTGVLSGNPDPDHISTSFVERSNLSMRMGMRRFTRLTNGFSKKLENHGHMVALYFMHYNYCRIHKTLRVTPAMQSGLTDHVWELEELVSLLKVKAAF
jgi:IS1 family transposase